MQVRACSLFGEFLNNTTRTEASHDAALICAHSERSNSVASWLLCGCPDTKTRGGLAAMHMLCSRLLRARQRRSRRWRVIS